MSLKDLTENDLKKIKELIKNTKPEELPWVPVFEEGGADNSKYKGTGYVFKNDNPDELESNFWDIVKWNDLKR